MRTKLLKKILAIALSLAAVVCVSIGLSNTGETVAQAQIIEINNVLDSKIALNTEVEVAASTTVDYQGEKTAKNGVVVFPDGRIVQAGKVKFNQAGVYQLKYFFEHLGVTHTAVQKVEVYSDYFNLSNPNGGEIIVSNEDTPLYCKKDGVIVKLKSGTKFLYNKVVDLRECGEDGLSNIIELDGRYGHFEDGAYVPDVLEGWVRLTDCYNPNLYIELRMQKSVNYNGCLFPGVKTNNQPVTGMDKGVTQVLGDSRIITLDGINYRVWMTNGSMNVGMYNMATAMTTGAVWKYDMNTQRVYLSYNNGENFLVTDLDEPLIYTNGNFFPGFTTGEVYVSIYANGYESTYANTEIVSIGNDNLKDVVGLPCVDTVAPEIVINQEKTTETGVYGAIGDVFTIPSAKAIDVNLVDGMDVAVYRGYATNMQTNVSVVNNQFTMTEKDVYTIVYTAKDKTGNVGKGIFTVSALETPDSRAITLTPMQAQTVKAGERVGNLYEIDNAINVDAQDVEVQISVENANQNLVGAGQDFSFTPYFEGKYTVRYQYTDGVFSYEKSVELTCERSSNICFIDEVTAPRYYLKGEYYAIEDIKAHTFVNGYPEPSETTVYAVFDNGAEQKIDDLNKVQITGDSSVYFLYKGKNGVTLVTDKTTIINADYHNALGKKLGFDMSKFFVGDYTANAQNALGMRARNITFTSNKNSGDNMLSYFNAVSGRKFALEYKVVANEANFTSLKINLTDAENADNQLSLEVFNNEDAAYYSVNGGALTKAELIGFQNTIINVSYDYDGKFLRIGSYASIVDFDASKVYVDVEMRGIKGKSSIIISKINNTTIAGNTYTDTIEPEIYVYDFQGDYAVGDKVKVSLPEFSDVISGIDVAKAKFTITCSDGGAVLQADGTPLTNVQLGTEYEILLDRIAKYFVIYEIYDFDNNVARKTVTVNCVDTIAPTITLDNLTEGQTLRVQAGSELSFNFTVSDNITKPKEIITYIHLYCIDMFSYVPNVSGIKQVNAPDNGQYKEKFVISICGKYQAQINAIDEQGNLCVKNIDIIVE